MPQLPLDTVLRSQPRATAQPVPPVVVTHKKRVGWCNPEAVEAGIQPGVSEANAWSMAAGLELHARDIAEERQALQEAALWMLHFTPQVALSLSLQDIGNANNSSNSGNCGLLAEIEPSLGLFGGLRSLQARMARGIAELGLQGCWASAPTATGAWLLAQTAALTAIDATHVSMRSHCRSRAEAVCLLDTLPLSVLACAAAHIATLNSIGCTTLGGLRRLPRGGLARRFGKTLLDEIDRAYGDQPEVHRWFVAPETIDLKLELPARVDTTEALLFAARRLLLQLTGWLTARHAATAGITLWLHHEPTRKLKKSIDAADAIEAANATNASRSAVTITLAAPSRDADHLGLLLRERLGQTTLVAPVVEIALVADQVTNQPAPNTELFPTVVSDIQSMARLVERLQSRLGTEAVRILATNADHRPEKSHASPVLRQQRLVYGNCTNHSNCTASVQMAIMRPGWLLPEPLALLTRQHRPFYQSPLTLLAGPDRIETGWWDDALALRDYFIAENDRHVLLWIFRLRPDGRGPEEDWFLHGFFA